MMKADEHTPMISSDATSQAKPDQHSPDLHCLKGETNAAKGVNSIHPTDLRGVILRQTQYP